MALNNSQLEQAIDMLVETIDEALKLVSNALALHNRVLLQLSKGKVGVGVDADDFNAMQQMDDAWKQLQQEQKP